MALHRLFVLISSCSRNLTDLTAALSEETARTALLFTNVADNTSSIAAASTKLDRLESTSEDRTEDLDEKVRRSCLIPSN